MKELESRFPGLTQDHVRFEVTQEDGSDGPAHVRAEVDEEAWRSAAGHDPR